MRPLDDNGRMKINLVQTNREKEIQEAIEETMTIPEQEPGNQKSHVVFMTTTRPEGYIASDQTGKFPVQSTRGMNYLCIFYIHDPNFIKSVPIKSRQKGELHRAYEEVYQ